MARETIDFIPILICDILGFNKRGLFKMFEPMLLNIAEELEYVIYDLYP